MHFGGEDDGVGRGDEGVAVDGLTDGGEGDFACESAPVVDYGGIIAVPFDDGVEVACDARGKQERMKRRKERKEEARGQGRSASRGWSDASGRAERRGALTDLHAREDDVVLHALPVAADAVHGAGLDEVEAAEAGGARDEVTPDLPEVGLFRLRRALGSLRLLLSGLDVVGEHAVVFGLHLECGGGSGVRGGG